MVRDVDADRSSLRAVQEALQRGDHMQAATLAEAARQGGLEHPLLLNVIALRFEQHERFAEALLLLEQAVALASADLGSRNALGLCLMSLARPEEALVHFEALLELNGTLAFAHVSRGNALLALGDIAAAEASYRHALTLDSRHGIALASLAHIAASRGDYSMARESAEQALTLLPGYPDADMGLAAAELGQRQAPRAEVRLRALLTDTRLSPLERASAGGLLGDVLDAQDRRAEAFSAYTASNGDFQRIYAPRYADAGALEYVRETSRYFDSIDSSAWKSKTPSDDSRAASGHVFVLSFPRSGTTLLEVILEGHPNVVSLEEKETLLDGVREFMNRPADLDRLVRASPAKLHELRAAYWARVAAGGVAGAGKTFVDKYPLNSLKLPLIARLFPDAKILFAARDPRDVVLSCFRHRFKMSAPIYELLSLQGTASYYDAVMGLVVRLSSVLPLDTCLVRHEDLVTEFAREMKRICAFIGLDFAPAMGDFALRTQKRTVLTPSTAQLVRGLNTEGLGQWRRYALQLAPVLPALDPWIKRFYYPGV